MKIQLTCKLFDNDAFCFLKPITDINKTEKIFVYRDKKGIYNSKIVYIISKFNKTYFRFIYRFFQMLFNFKKCDVLVGIYEMPHGLLALLVSILRKKPVVVSVIGNPKHERRTKGLHGKIIHIILKKCNVITVTGTVGRNYYTHEKKYTHEKVFVLPNSIDTKEYNTNNTEKKYDIITLGRLSSVKGLDYFINIIAKLKLTFPNIKVGIAGKGQILEELQQLIDSLYLSENVILLGYVEDPVEFLNSGKVFLTTSKTEGLPRTVIQSLACGTPVVASNVGDLSDLIINNKTGFLIEEYKEENFVKAVSSILNSSEKRNKLSQSGKEFVKNNYDHKAATQVWIDIFKYLNL